jgi:hypothetical protein
LNPGVSNNASVLYPLLHELILSNLVLITVGLVGGRVPGGPRAVDDAVAEELLPHAVHVGVAAGLVRVALLLFAAFLVEILKKNLSTFFFSFLERPT